MRELFNVIIAFMLLGSIFSCKKDLGNYEYVSIDSLIIKGIDDTYNIKSGQKLELKPEVTFVSNKKFIPEEYEFEWLSYRTGVSIPQPQISLGHTQFYEEEFPLGIGKYRLFYRIKEKKTNITWTKEILIDVAAAFNGGWMILTENNDKSRLDFFEWDHNTKSYLNVHRDFQEQIKDSETGDVMPLKGRPKWLQAWDNAPNGISNSPLFFIYVGTDEGTEKINMTDGAIWNERYSFKWETSNPPAFETIDNIIPSAASDGLIIKGNDVYLRLRTMAVNIGVPINRLGDGSYFRVSPHVAAYQFFIPSFLMYDIDNKRFVVNNNFNTISSSPLAYNSNSAFNPNDVGMDLVWMNQTVAFGGRAYAVLTKDGRYYLARMDNSMMFSALHWDEISDCPEIADASFFEVDQRYGYLQYVVDGRIYQYDPDEKTTKLMKDYGSRRVSLFKYSRSPTVAFSHVNNNPDTYGQRFEPLTIGLVCATYDPADPNTSGVVEILKVPQFSAPFETYLSFEGFGKVLGAVEAEKPFGW